MAQRKPCVSPDQAKPNAKRVGKKTPESIGRRKFFKLGVRVGVAALPYVIPTIYTFTVPQNAFACHMGVTHMNMACGT